MTEVVASLLEQAVISEHRIEMRKLKPGTQERIEKQQVVSDLEKLFRCELKNLGNNDLECLSSIVHSIMEDPDACKLVVSEIEQRLRKQ